MIQWNYMRYMISTVLENILGLCWSAKTVNYVWVAFSLSTCASMSFLSLPSCLVMKDKDQMWEASQIFLPVPNQKRERKKVSNILCKYLCSSRIIICQIVSFAMEMLIYPLYYWTSYNQQIEYCNVLSVAGLVWERNSCSN